MFSQYFYLSFGWKALTCQKLQKCALSCSVISHKAVDAALSHMDIYMVQRQEGTVGFRNLSCFHHIPIHLISSYTKIRLSVRSFPSDKRIVSFSLLISHKELLKKL